MAEVTGLAALDAAGLKYTIIQEINEGEMPVANSTEAPYSISFKTSKSTLITVRGESADELMGNLSKMAAKVPTEDGPASPIDVIREIENSISGAAGGGGQQAAQGGSQSQQTSLTPPCKTCGATTTEKSGTGKRGPWKGYFCTNDKDHTPNWA